MNAVGIYLPPGTELVANGENWRRFKPVNGSWKRSKDAYYGIWEKFLSSGKSYYFGIFGIAGEQYTITHNRTGWTADEWQEIQQRSTEDNRIVEEAVENKRKEAAQKANQMWNAATPSVSADHPYVKKKQIIPVGARQLKNQILVPVYKDQKLTGLQTIFQQVSPNDEVEILKLFLKGTDKKGAFCPLGTISETPEVIFVCEGWATGCSIHHAVKRPVIVAFDAGNIEPVVVKLRTQYPAAKIVICADNDAHYQRELLEDVRQQLKTELTIGASSSTPVQYVNTTEGQYELRAWWSKEDGLPCIIYTIKKPGQKKANKRVLRNTGVAYAKFAASQHHCCLQIPTFANKETTGTDYNDLATEEGLGAVIKQLSGWKDF